MNVSVFMMFALLISCLQTVNCRLPDFTPTTPRLQVDMSVNSAVVTSEKKKKGLTRLPGLCRRLKRRRVTILCNREKFCWWGRSQGQSPPGQVCRCPRGSRCSQFFLKSL